MSAWRYAIRGAVDVCTEWSSAKKRRAFDDNGISLRDIEMMKGEDEAEKHGIEEERREKHGSRMPSEVEMKLKYRFEE
jgi:hypothetical protein